MPKKIVSRKLNPKKHAKKRWIVSADADDDIGEIGWSAEVAE